MRRILAVLLITIAAQSCQNSKLEIATVEDVLNNQLNNQTNRLKLKDEVEVYGRTTKTKKGFVYEAKNIRNVKSLSAE